MLGKRGSSLACARRAARTGVGSVAAPGRASSWPWRTAHRARRIRLGVHCALRPRGVLHRSEWRGRGRACGHVPAAGSFRAVWRDRWREGRARRRALLQLLVATRDAKERACVCAMRNGELVCRCKLHGGAYQILSVVWLRHPWLAGTAIVQRVDVIQHPLPMSRTECARCSPRERAQVVPWRRMGGDRQLRGDGVDGAGGIHEQRQPCIAAS